MGSLSLSNMPLAEYKACFLKKGPLGAFKTAPLSSCCPGIVQRISNGNKKTSY